MTTGHFSRAALEPCRDFRLATVGSRAYHLPRNLDCSAVIITTHKQQTHTYTPSSKHARPHTFAPYRPNQRIRMRTRETPPGLALKPMPAHPPARTHKWRGGDEEAQGKCESKGAHLLGGNWTRWYGLAG